MLERFRRAIPAATGPMVLLASLLAIRNVSDMAARESLLGPLRLNLSSLLGVVAIGWAVVLLAPSLWRRRFADVRGLRAAGLLIAFLTIWLGVGFVVHGTQPSLVREWVRFLSVIAVGLVAANLRSVPSRQLVGLVLLALLVPILVAVGQLVAHASAIGPQGSNDFYRAPGTFVQANKAAQSFLLAIGLAGWAVLERPRALAAGVMAVAAVIALLATRSLGGIAAAGTAVVAFLLLRPASARFRLALLGGLALFAVVFALTPFGASRLASLADTRLPWDIVGKTHNSLEWRFFNWWHLMGDWSRQPIFGHGLGSTLQIVRPIDFITHSDPVRLLVEGGVVGAAIGVAFIGWAYAATVGVVRRATGARLRLATVMLAVLIGLGVQSLVQNTLSNTALLYMLAVVFGQLWVGADARARAAR